MATYLPTNHAYNLEQIHSRDFAVQHYHSDLFRTRRIQRVFVVDIAARVALLTTPMRAISAWHKRESQLAAQQQLPNFVSYTSLSGIQLAVPEETAERYLNVLACGRQRKTVLSSGGNVTFHAIRMSTARSMVTGGNQ